MLLFLTFSLIQQIKVYNFYHFWKYSLPDSNKRNFMFGGKIVEFYKTRELQEGGKSLRRISNIFSPLHRWYTQIQDCNLFKQMLWCAVSYWVKIGIRTVWLKNNNMQTVRDKRHSMSYVVVSKAKVKRDWLIETTKIIIKPSHKSRKCLKQIFSGMNICLMTRLLYSKYFGLHKIVQPIFHAWFFSRFIVM